MFIVAAALLLGGCTGGEQRTLNEAQVFLDQWLKQASAELNGTNQPSCHGYGELMFPAASCADMYEHAKRINPASRVLDRVNSLDCFGSGPQRVCGEFVEIWYRSKDASGRDIKEGAVVKRDDGEFRLYWYRSDLLFTTLAKRAEQAERSLDEANPNQGVLTSSYNQLVALHPELYQYPPCLEDIRVSSSTMIGAPMKLQNLQPTDVHQRAAQCSIDICFAAVGQKLTTLCPKEYHD